VTSCKPCACNGKLSGPTVSGYIHMHICQHVFAAHKTPAVCHVPQNATRQFPPDSFLPDSFRPVGILAAQLEAGAQTAAAEPEVRM
jgi:hypothetical protein